MVCDRTARGRKPAGAWLWLALAGLCGVVAGLSGTAAAETLVLQGSTTFTSAVMTEHQPEVEAASGQTLRVLPNKTNLGLQALLDGKADLAMTSTALENEVGLLKPGIHGATVEQLHTHQITRSNAVIIVHADNAMRSISPGDLRRIMLGELTNWRDLGGPDLPIRLVATREGGGVVTSVEARVLGVGLHIKAPNAVRLQNGPQIVLVVEQERGAIGITIDKLVQGRRVNVVGMGEPVALQLNLVSLGEPTAVMQRVIDGCRAVALQYGL
jgi:phosphate transport system substrate-binding protein